MSKYKQQPKNLFGSGKADAYLVDTLNKLESERVLARSMASISTARHNANRMIELTYKGHISTSEGLNLLRVQIECHNRLNKARQEQLDEELAAWRAELTSEGLERKQLEVLAAKLAMNISTAAYRYAVDVLRKRRAQEQSRASKLRNLMKEVNLPPELDLSTKQEDAIRAFLRNK
jgi:hypothetical protein